MTERRFVCINFEQGTISAWVSVAGNKAIRAMKLGDGSTNLREVELDFGQLSQFRLNPTTFGKQTQAALPPPEVVA